MNQSDNLSKHGTGVLQEEFMDIKNRLVDFSNSKPKPHHNLKIKNLSAPFGESLLEYVDNEDRRHGQDDDSDLLRGETVQSIEDATGRLSNLVRLMDENSKLIQPSDLTVQSYKSSIVGGGARGETSDNQGEGLDGQRSFSKQLNSFFGVDGLPQLADQN